MTIDSTQKKVAVMTPDGKRDYVSMTEFMDSSAMQIFHKSKSETLKITRTMHLHTVSIQNPRL
mgnify:CR=1 FL=1